MVLEVQDPLMGKSLGGYKIIEYLGSGAMAKVFKGYHQDLNRHAAIKVMDAQFLIDHELVDMFKLEGRNLASLSHPNIVQIHDLVVNEDIVYMVMEFIEGTPLSIMFRDAKKKKKIIPITESVGVIKAVCEALSFAHDKNVIHRDVKPSNILVENTKRVTLVDFGFAKMITGDTKIQTGRLYGTPAYMAPEQTQGLPTRGQADIYSLGVVFYELVTNQTPFSDDEPLALAVKHINQEIPRPRSIASRIPRRIEIIIMKALARETKNRYQTIDEMLTDINKLPEANTGHLPTATLEISNDHKTDPKIKVDKSKEEQIVRFSLHFMETGQILEIPEGNEFTIGRHIEGESFKPDINLTPYDGHKWGISRNHARLLVGLEEIILKDSESTNGTWINGKRIQANKPVKIEHGNVIQLGRLKVQFLVYREREFSGQENWLSNYTPGG
ncbi:MAG: FHA domain-containing serine/threonine-protein kinase [Chloroflexota bacterium]